MNYYMMVCMPSCMYDVNVCVLRQIAHRCWKTNFGSLQCVNWKDKIKEIKNFRNLFGLLDNEIKF